MPDKSLLRPCGQSRYVGLIVRGWMAMAAMAAAAAAAAVVVVEMAPVVVAAKLKSNHPRLPSVSRFPCSSSLLSSYSSSLSLRN